MKTIRHGRNARDPLLHIEADGVLVNIRVGLTDTEGHHVTRLDISPDDEYRGGDDEGYYWYQDGARIIRLHADERPPEGHVPQSLPLERINTLRAHAAAAAAEVLGETLPSRVQLLVDAIEELTGAPIQAVPPSH